MKMLGSKGPPNGPWGDQVKYLGDHHRTPFRSIIKSIFTPINKIRMPHKYIRILRTSLPAHADDIMASGTNNLNKLNLWILTLSLILPVQLKVMRLVLEYLTVILLQQKAVAQYSPKDQIPDQRVQETHAGQGEVSHIFPLQEHVCFLSCRLAFLCGRHCCPPVCRNRGRNVFIHRELPSTSCHRWRWSKTLS